MTKFKVVRYFDTYPDGVVATCDTQEEAERFVINIVETASLCTTI